MRKKFCITLAAVSLIFMGCGSTSADIKDDAPRSVQASPVAKKVPSFNAKTTSGSIVTNEIFAAKKITVVNIWGTFCPPCIAEMPDLAEMSRSVPDDAQIIGLVCDAAENSIQVQKAQEILGNAGADFVNIIPDANLMKFMDNVEAVPTTIFVNSAGEVVGKAIIGANVNAYKAEMEKLLRD